nr:hypothetical protein QQAWYXWE_QQAWYXWE_CDS_0008 [Microvirus sp.]
MKCWNVRDQTDTKLAEILARTYKEIEATYKHVRAAATIEDAKFYIDMAFRKKAFANDIEMEQIRRRINHGEEE